jgi:hypothetical protein
MEFMMKANNGNFSLKLFWMLLLLNLVGLTQVAAGGLRTASQTNRKRYLGRAPAAVNMEDYLDDSIDQQLQLLMTTHKNNNLYAFYLSDAEFTAMQNATNNTNVEVQLDPIITLSKATSAPTKATMAPTSAPQPAFVTQLQSCSLPIQNNVVIAQLDTAIYAEHPSLKNINIKVGYDYTNGKLGETHGSSVAYIIAGSGGVANTGSRSIVNYIVFDNMGNGYGLFLIDACAKVVALKKELAKQGKAVILNFSGATGGVDSPVNEAFETVYAAEVAPVVAAANYGAPCSNYSPAGDLKVIAVGGSDGNVIDPSSDYNCPQNMPYLPFCVQTPSFTTMINDHMVDFCGTSGSTPQFVGYELAYLSYRPYATPDDVRADYMSRAFEVSSPNGPLFLLPEDNACTPDPLIAEKLNFGPKTKAAFTTWYDAVKYDNFCVEFFASSPSGSLALALRDGNQSTIPLQMTLNKKQGNSFFSEIIVDGNTVNTTTTKNNILKAGTRFRVNGTTNNGNTQLTVWHNTNKGLAKLLEVATSENVDRISFSSTTAAYYSNIIRC